MVNDKASKTDAWTTSPQDLGKNHRPVPYRERPVADCWPKPDFETTGRMPVLVVIKGETEPERFAPKPLFPTQVCGGRVIGRKGQRYCSEACAKRALRAAVTT